MEPHFDFDFDPVSFITIGAEGPPGERTFFLQAAKGRKVVTVAIEKEQAFVLAANLQHLLVELGELEEEPDEGDTIAEEVPNMALLQPVRPQFRVTRLGLGVDAATRQMVIIADETQEGDDGQRVRFVASFKQMLALSKHTLWVVGQGRPNCPLCGEPMDEAGHFCARRNGHPKPPDENGSEA